MEMDGNIWKSRGTDDERCEIGWRLAIAMDHGLLTYPLGLYIMGRQIITLYILMEFSLFFLTKSKGSLDDGLSLSRRPCETALILMYSYNYTIGGWHLCRFEYNGLYLHR
jgi:hypothetical protein